jgi:flagellar basal-body rod modification protein FlgD
MASPISALTNTNATSTPSSSSSLGGSAAPTEQVFLQLLVSQIKNQDPLNPTDSTQFVSQLAQFSELEQVLAIRGDLDTMTASSASQTTTPASTTPAPSTSAPGSTQTTNPSGQTTATGQTQS